MSRPTQDKIETYMSITGASHSLAVQCLEEYGGNLDEALNAHYGELETHLPNSVSAAPQYGSVNTRNQTPDDSLGISGYDSLNSRNQTPDGSRGISQYDSLDSRNHTPDGSRGITPLLSAARGFTFSSLLLDPNYRRQLANQIGSSIFPRREPPHSHTVDFNYGYQQPHYSGRPTPVFEPGSATSLPPDNQFHGNVLRVHETNLNSSDSNDIEEQMIQSAIENSRREEISGHPHLEDDELARALSLSLKTAEQEKATRELTLEDQKQTVIQNSTGRANNTNESRLQPRSSSQQGAEHLPEQSLWGAVSSKEIDEAILLEETFFGKTPEGTSQQLEAQPPAALDIHKGHRPQQVLGCTSPSLMEQRLLREQQDVEYLASLLADREKEMNTANKPGTSCFEEGGSANHILNDEAEFERLIAAKQASLPEEPEVNAENAVTLLIRMSDGSRCQRRFLKSDKLKFLFDFIDVGKIVKPGSYRVVRPFPRRSFSTADSSMSLQELGLTNKQEALFLELI